jgi:hypothetical protein
MMEAVRTSETSIDNHSTRQYNPEDSSEHHIRRRENLKSHKLTWLLQQRQKSYNHVSYTIILQYVLCVQKQSKAVLIPPSRLQGERRYSSFSFLISEVDGDEWLASRPGRALPPGKDPRYPLYRRLGGPQSRSGHRG